MDKAISNIVIALIFSAVALYGFGAFSHKDLPYATVRYDGGHQVVGVILKQHSYSEVEFSSNGETFTTGDISEIIDYLDEAEAEVGVDVFDYIKDHGGNAVIEGEVGVFFDGTLSSFQLTIDKFHFSSDDQDLSSEVVKNALREIERKIKNDFEAHANSALTYNKAPQEL